MRVALVYDRLNKIGGAEKVLLAFHDLFPDADWYTSFWDPATAPFSRTWRVHHFPFLHHHHEWFPFLMPFIFEAYDLSSYDLVISIGSAESKGIITKPSSYHLHYCLTPTRYLYSHADEYLDNPLYRFVAKYLRFWDQVASSRPDKMIAISTQVKNRIKKYYNRDSEVIFPPVDTQRFALTDKPSIQRANPQNRRFADLPDKYFLTVSRLVPYKRIDILIRAFNQMPDRHLVVVGTGSELARLKRLSRPNTHFVGYVSDVDLPAYYQHALAFLQANEEDFGISMVEAQAAGTPVIAYQKGGASDIVIDQITGLLLPDNKVKSVVAAIDNFGQIAFDRGACRQNAKRFDLNKWNQQLTKILRKYDRN